MCGVRVGVRRQRGAIGLMAALLLGLLALLLMLVVDSGRLYLEQRKLQRMADLAALESAMRGGCAEGGGQADAQLYARENVIRGYDQLPVDTVLAVCGVVWADEGRRRFQADTVAPGPLLLDNAVQVRVARAIPSSVVLGGWFGERVELAASAVAARREPLAQLSIRSTLLEVDSERGVLLNALFGGLLGGSVDLPLAGWQGLAAAELNLLGYLDALALELGVQVGHYEELLQTEAALSTLLGVAAESMARQGGTADLGAAVAGLELLAASVPAGAPLLRLADVLMVQSGTPAAGLDLGLNALQLAQAMVQLANSENAAVAELPLSVPGLAGVSVRLKVIEPPQLSAIGNPELAQVDPYGEHQLFVRTAQVRALVSVDLGGVSGVSGELLDTATAALTPIANFLNGVLSLNLVEAIENFLGGVLCGGLIPCDSADALSVRELPDPRLDLSLELGAGSARMLEHDCAGEDDKSLTVLAESSALSVRLGKMGEDAADAASRVFASHELPTTEPASLLLIGSQGVRPDSCVLLLCSGLKWRRGEQWIDDRGQADFELQAGFGLELDSTLAGHQEQLVYSAPAAEELPELGEPPYYQRIESADLATGLDDTLSGVSVMTYRSDEPGLLGALLGGAGSIAGGLLEQLGELLGDTLGGLADPLLELLLEALGLDIGIAEVGANLTCGGRVDLVI